MLYCSELLFTCKDIQAQKHSQFSHETLMFVMSIQGSIIAQPISVKLANL
jgi:hypothetical protein